VVHATVGFAIKDAWRNNWLLLESAAGVKKVNYGVVAHWSPSHQPNSINLVKVWGKVRHAVPEISLRTDRKTDTHTHTQTDTLITILWPYRGGVIIVNAF